MKIGSFWDCYWSLANRDTHYVFGTDDSELLACPNILADDDNLSIYWQYTVHAILLKTARLFTFHKENLSRDCHLAMRTLVVQVYTLQYRHLIPAPVVRTSASTWFYKRPWITCRKNKPSTSMTHVACESKLHSFVRLPMHPWPGNWVAIGHVVVNSARTAHANSAEIKCRHCMCNIHYCYRSW